MLPKEEVPFRRPRKKKEVLPCNSTPMCFFSRAGQKILSRIWEDHNLSEELIFSGLIGGPTEAFIREQVSDYIQSYLQYRSRRSYIVPKSEENVENNLNTARRNVYVKFDEWLHQIIATKDETRIQNEKQRVDKLIRDRLMEPFGEFKYIGQDPVFLANKLLENIKQLQKKEPYKPFDFAQKSLPPIRHRHSSRQNNTHNTSGFTNCSKVTQPVVFCSTPKSSLSRIESPSSGFLEITPSNNLTNDEQNLYAEGEDEFPTPLVDNEISVSSNFSEADIFEFAELDLDGCSKISGDLDFQMQFTWESPLLKEANEKNTVPQIYDSSNKVLGMYRRQLIFGQKFLKKWNSLNKKPFSEVKLKL